MSLKLFLPKEQTLNKSVWSTSGYFLSTATSYTRSAVGIPLLECRTACQKSICTLKAQRPNNVTKFLQDFLRPWGKCWFGTQIPRRTANFSCTLPNININIPPLMQSAQRWCQNSTMTQQVLKFLKHYFHNFLSEGRMELTIMKRLSFPLPPQIESFIVPRLFLSLLLFLLTFYSSSKSQELHDIQNRRNYNLSNANVF